MTGCRPRLYVYDLPNRYRYEGRPEGQGFPPPLNLTDNDAATLPSSSLQLLHSTDTYVAGGIFFARAMTHPCRTLDPAMADLFFIPAFTDAFHGEHICADQLGRHNCSRNRMFERLEMAAPGRLRARNGSDHIILSPRHGFHYDVSVSYELRLTDSRLGNAIRFAMEEGDADYPWPGPQRVKRFFRSTPFPSLVHASSDAPWDALPWRTTDRARRSVLIAIAFNAVHKAGPAVGQLNTLRDRLLRSCQVAGDPSVCTLLPLSPTNVQIKGYHMHLLSNVVKLYWRSTFCLMPVGDACTRKATMDALLLGCIPVIFHPCQALQWPWHWGGWVRDATVFVDLNDVTDAAGKDGFDVVETLRRMPASQVARMQRIIATHAHCVHYRKPFGLGIAHPNGGGEQTPSAAAGAPATVGGAYDAFDITIVRPLCGRNEMLHARSLGAGLIAPIDCNYACMLACVSQAGAWTVARHRSGDASTSALSSLCRMVPIHRVPGRPHPQRDI